MFKKVFAAMLAMCLLFATIPALAAGDAPFGRFSAENTHGGKKVTESIFKNAELTLVNLWATWCGPCKGELPALAKLESATNGRAQVVGIQLDALDTSGNLDKGAVDAANTLLSAAGATFPNLIPDNWLMQIGGLAQSIPTTFLVDSKGNIVDVVVNAHDEAGWLEIIEEHIGAK